MMNSFGTGSFDHLKHDLRSCRDVVLEYLESKELALAKLAKGRIDDMMSSRQRTLDHLSHSDSKIRLAALLLLIDYWKPDADTAGTAWRHLACETDAAARGVAQLLSISCRLPLSEKAIRQLLHGADDAEEPGPQLVDATTSAAGLAKVRRRYQWLESSAGDCLEGMLEKPDNAVCQLGNENPKIVVAAIYLLTFHWSLPRIAEQLKDLVRTHKDAEVRDCALVSLGVFFENSNDAELGMLAAKLVKDKAESEKLRMQAYNLLYQIRGRRVTTWPNSLALSRKGFRFPEDVDWSLVDSFL